jgi:integrase
MSSAFKRGKTWVASWKDASGDWRSERTSFPTKAETVEYARKLEELALLQSRGIGPLAASKPARVVTFGELMDAYHEHRGVRLRSQTYKGFVEKHFRAELGRLPLTDVTSERLDRLLTSKEGQLTPESINELRSFAYRFFEYARFPGVGFWFTPNPVDVVPRRKVPKRLPVYLRWDEVARLLDACVDDPDVEEILATAIYTGQRKGEILGLLKSDVNWSDETMLFARTYDRETTKDAEEGLVPIAPELAPYLRRAIERHPHSPFLFPDAEGQMRTKESTLRTWFCGPPAGRAS